MKNVSGPSRQNPATFSSTKNVTSSSWLCSPVRNLELHAHALKASTIFIPFYQRSHNNVHHLRVVILCLLPTLLTFVKICGCQLRMLSTSLPGKTGSAGYSNWFTQITRTGNPQIPWPRDSSDVLDARFKMYVASHTSGSM